MRVKYNICCLVLAPICAVAGSSYRPFCPLANFVVIARSFVLSARRTQQTSIVGRMLARR